jgi:hypothetical protein
MQSLIVPRKVRIPSFADPLASKEVEERQKAPHFLQELGWQTVDR